MTTPTSTPPRPNVYEIDDPDAGPRALRTLVVLIVVIYGLTALFLLAAL